MKRGQLFLVGAFIAAMLVVGEMRRAAYAPSMLSDFAPYATIAYVAATVLFAVLLARAGVRMHRVGFGFGLRLSHVALGLLGVAALQLSAAFVAPLIEAAVGAPRDLGRFEDIAGSPERLFALLALSWTFAAFGEEIAFRIVMMRSIASALGDGAVANAAALIIQAIVFGLVHLYQGPAGVAGAAVNGLIYGGLTLAARGAIWPAAIAHGGGNTIGIVAL